MRERARKVGEVSCVDARVLARVPRGGSECRCVCMCVCVYACACAGADASVCAGCGVGGGDSESEEKGEFGVEGENEGGWVCGHGCD